MARMERFALNLSKDLMDKVRYSCAKQEIALNVFIRRAIKREVELEETTEALDKRRRGQ